MKKINILVIIMSLLFLFAIPTSSFANSEDEEIDKDKGVAITSTETELNGFDKIPDDVIEFVKNEYGNAIVEGWHIYQNNENDVYSIVVNKEKIGWI